MSKDVNDKVVEALIVWIFAIAGIWSIIIFGGLLLAFPIRWCWNYTMPYLFDLKSISWGQAWCLSFLTATLLKNINYKMESK